MIANSQKWTACALIVLGTACSGSDYQDNPVPHGSEAGGTGGGTAGAAGVAGPSGAGGWSAGTGGAAGAAGSGGVAGSAGSAGAAEDDAGPAEAGDDSGGTGATDAGGDGDTADTSPDASGDGSAGGPDASSGGTGGTGGSAPDASAPDAPEVCNDGWDNCHGASGCATNIDSDPNNCGGCDIICEPLAHATAGCESMQCSYTCASGYGDCDEQSSNGCENDLSSVQHCHACGSACPAVPHADPTCTSSGCSFDCDTSWGDCDDAGATGCEVNLTNTVAHCGACNHACPPRANAVSMCTSSSCTFACNTGFASCDNVDANGCEANLNNDVLHCGSCTKACGTANGVASCSAMSCSIQCNAGYGDCDGANPNGCEVNLLGDIDNCGACNVACGDANGTPSCTGGSCSIVCAAGFADCDGINGNGCEVNLNTDEANCGVCDRDCLDTNCATGMCFPAIVNTHSGGIRDFQVTDDYLYRLSATALMRFGKSGGTLGAALANNLTAANSLVIDGYAYWGEEKLSGRVLRAPLAYTIPTPAPTVMIADGGDIPHAIDYAGGWLYWIGSSTVIKGKSGVTPTALADTSLYATGLIVDGSYVYWVVPASSGAVERVSVTGGATTHLASGLNEPSDLALDSTRAYWVNHGSGTVQSVAKSGGTVTTIASGQVGPNRIALIDDDVYWTASDGTIHRASKSGGGDFVLAKNQTNPTVIRVDDDYVYWLKDGTSVVRVAR